MSKPVWYQPEDSTPKYQCPCCDHITLLERGNYLICPVFFWEDDGQDVDQLEISSGPNHGLTLKKGRENFKTFGACEKSMMKNVCSDSERSQYDYHPRHL